MALLAFLAATQAPQGVAALAMALDPGPAAPSLGPLSSLLPLLLLGFTRLLPSQAAANPVRRAVLEALAEGRCRSIGDLHRQLGVSRKTVGYHLHLLHRAGLVVVRGKRNRPLFASAAHARTALPEARLLEQPNRRALWDAAQERPGATAPELVQATGLRSGTAHFHLRALERAGLLAAVDAGGRRGYVAVAPGSQQPSPDPVLQRRA